jgi:general L-amino acid transport system permease protein
MTVYVEVFRNIPLLLWIILSLRGLFRSMPKEPKDFKVTQEMVDDRGPEGRIYPAASMIFDTVAITNRGTNMPKVLAGTPLGRIRCRRHSDQLRPSSPCFAVIVGIALCEPAASAAQAKVVQEATGTARHLVEKPGVILFAADHRADAWRPWLHFEVSRLPRERGGVSRLQLPGWDQRRPFLYGASDCAVLYSATYIAEGVRGGILAISRGQTEAAYALGLRPGRTMRLIILPQALRVIIPPLISQYLNITKNTTLGMAISYLDLKGTLGGITLNQTGRELECMLLMMLTYLCISLMISAGDERLQQFRKAEGALR